MFCPFTPLLTPKIKIWKKCKKHLKWRSYDVWSLRCKARQTEFLVILGHFLPFDPPNNPKIQSFRKMKITPGDMIILHLCTKNDDHMMYGDMECDRQNFPLFWTIFCPFTSLKTQKIKILKKWKKTPVHQKSWSYMLYCPWYPWDWAIILPSRPPPPLFLPSLLPKPVSRAWKWSKITENCHFIFCIFAKDEILLSQILHCRKQTWRAFAEYFRNFPYFTH